MKAPMQSRSDRALPTLVVENLRTHFFTRAGVVKAVDGVGFTVQAGVRSWLNEAVKTSAASGAMRGALPSWLLMAGLGCTGVALLLLL